ncbi:MAG TPA: hypothetical protein VK745_22700 [Polyangiaceae bacterium]|jgi:hypothetical protein|nr:hypothetical protein [Polyangiaceae bacterium]
MAGPPSRSTFPSASGDPSSRRLGVGSSSSRDRPLRAQIVVALVVVCILIAVPLYLLRRPGGKSGTVPSASAAALDAGKAPLALASAGAAVTPLDAGKPPERLRVAAVQRVRCGASAGGGHEGNVCDSVPPFEEALSKAVRDNPDCAPKANEQGTVNYVLTVDFTKKSLHLFPGASGSWRGRQARRAVTCVKHAFVQPDWTTIQHQYRFYTIAVLGTYFPLNGGSAANTAAGPHNPLATPNFE